MICADTVTDATTASKQQQKNFFICGIGVGQRLRPMARTISPPTAISDVLPMITAHSRHASGSVRKTSPPNSTMSTCPTAMANRIRKNSRHPRRQEKTEWRVSKPLALNIFQNCRNTNVEKKTVSWRTVSPPVVIVHQNSMPSNIATMTMPHVKSVRAMARVMMNSLRGRGFSSITSGFGGSEAMAIAAKVSMIMFTHRICTTVSGMSVPNTAPTKQIRIAAKLIVS